MGNSIESRLPFMDYRVVELGLAIPDALKLRDGYGKWIVRHIMADRLPAQVAWTRSKRGFDVVLGRWLADGLGRTIRSALTTAMPRLSDYFAHPVRIEESFSDRCLHQDPGVFAEAVTAIWLAGTR